MSNILVAVMLKDIRNAQSVKANSTPTAFTRHESQITADDQISDFIEIPNWFSHY